jgi:hypothetical protein
MDGGCCSRRETLELLPHSSGCIGAERPEDVHLFRVGIGGLGSLWRDRTAVGNSDRASPVAASSKSSVNKLNALNTPPNRGVLDFVGEIEPLPCVPQGRAELANRLHEHSGSSKLASST